MAILIATGSSIQLPLGTVQILSVRMRSKIDPEYRRIFLNDSGPEYNYTNVSDILYNFNTTTSILTLQRDFGEVEISYVEPLDTEALKRIVPITKANTSAKRNRSVDVRTNNIRE
jgi:hypothetical protein